MSGALTPEAFVAWQQVKRDAALRPYEPLRAQRDRSSREWQRLLAELQESPTPEGLARFCELSAEVTTLTEQSYLVTLERNHRRNICVADLQDRMEGYYQLVDEHLRLLDFVHYQHAHNLQMEKEIERRKRVHAENELLKATRELQNYRDREGASTSPGDMGTMGTPTGQL